ncbi:MAG: hypothetical protein RAO94_09675 [Candidatus Stygibacter australis]|nr:hypothetical protein [Candidatus Stygibacter australis]MDP8322605.1 hypothetical protein [Candidatus Stygibacter australis]
MKDFGKKLMNVTFAIVMLGIGIKVMIHFLGKMECCEEEAEHREPYQPEE